jgi:hypothetical protein
MVFLTIEIDMILTLEKMMEKIENSQEKEGRTEEGGKEEDRPLLSQQLWYPCIIEHLDLEPGIKCRRDVRE